MKVILEIEEQSTPAQELAVLVYRAIAEAGMFTPTVTVGEQSFSYTELTSN